MLRKNVSGQFVCFQGVSASTGGILSGATWTMRRCLDGTFAAGGATITEDSTNGWYKVALTQADTNGNDISFNFTATGAIPQTINDTTTAADPTNAATFGITDIDATISSRLASSSYTAPANLTAAQIATGIWQDSTAGDFTAASSIGKSLYTTGNAPGAASGFALVGSNMGSASSVTGAVGSVTGNVGGNVTGSVGSVVGLTASNLDMAVSSRMATFTLPTNFSALAITAGGAVTAGTVSDKTGYTLTSAYDAAKTAAQAGDAMALTTAAQQAAADTLLGRNVAGGSSTGRLVKEALYVLRNKVDTGAGIVYQVDDTTSAWTFTVTTAVGNPITVVDPS